MQRSGFFFVIVGGIVCIGLALSIYGNQIIFEDLSKGETEIKFGENLIIPVELDSTKIQTGIYAVQIMDFREGITAKILDPTDNEIEKQKIHNDVFEGRFSITISGLYKLVIENTDEKEIRVFGVIGAEPDAGKKSLGFISLYVLVIGLIGMVGVTIYTIKKRRKS